MSLLRANGGGLGGAGAPGGALGNFYSHLLDQSIKFNNDDTQYFSRTPASAGNRKTYTFSAWVKRSSVGSAHTLLSCVNAGTSQTSININGTDNVEVSSSGSGFSAINVSTNAKLRDVSAWYNIVVAVDTEQATASNRVKIYLNGVDQSGTGYGLAASSYPVEDSEGTLNEAREITIGRFNQSGYFQYFDGYIAEVNFIDGTALDKDSFGETKDGIWIPKDTSSLTFGTNGFHLTWKDDVISEGFNTVTYTGTGATQSISGLGFSPALVWAKKRSASGHHFLFDAVRGAGKQLKSSTTDAETSHSNYLASFDADGFTIGSDSDTNLDGGTHVAWCWEAGGTPTADNSAGAGATPTSNSVKIDGSNLGSALAGTIPATKLTANTARGFSIVEFTTDGVTSGTVAHGLGVQPQLIIGKTRNHAVDWYVQSPLLATNLSLILNATDAAYNPGINHWNDTHPTTSVFSVGGYMADHADLTNPSTKIAYCFANVTGYSKIGTFQNNNSNTGTQVTGLGFKPAWILIKNTDNTERWFIQDNTRQPTNLAPPSGKFLVPNATSTEGQNGADTASIDFQDDGFQIKTTNPASGEISFGTRNYIYMAFADTREAAFFKDVTTNGNHFTPVNLDYRDSVPDVPTNSFATLNPLDNISTTYSEGNLQYAQSNYNYNSRGTMAVTSGKWYWEIYMNGTHGEFGVCENGKAGQSDPQANIGFNFIYNNGSAGISWKNATAGAQATTGISMTNWSAGDICQIAYDADNGILYHGLNGTYQTSGDPAARSGGLITGIAPQFGGTMVPFFGSGTGNARTWVVNFGHDSSFDGKKSTENTNADGNGHGSFAYAPPSGHLALCSQNLPEPEILDGTDNFNTVLYTGNESTRSITGVGFSPDFLWIKGRNTAQHHNLYDALRSDSDGPRRLFSSLAVSEESTVYSGTTNVSSLDADGFTMGNGTSVNEDTKTFVSWNWKAGGAAPTKTYTVKVVSDGGNKYRFDDFGTSAVTLELQEGGTYTFDQSDSSNSGHPLRFSTTSNGTHGGGSEYTTGVTTTGTPGNAGAKTVITVAASAATLYYYCTQHSGMGGQVNTNATFGSTHLDGSILSTVSANTKAGFSIVGYTGSGSNATVAHGLGVAPSMVIIKSRIDTSGDGNWLVYVKAGNVDETDYLLLNGTGQAEDEAGAFNDTAATTTTFSLGTFVDLNQSSKTYIAYCFANVEGYCKVGGFTGNNDPDGPFVYTGFRPAWVMVKQSSASGGWNILDNKRQTFNDATGLPRSYAYSNATEEDEDTMEGQADFLSNGFKLRSNHSSGNASGATIIYLAFAESPFKFSNAR